MYSSESNAETPRPPKRTATIGRFPIRPSISGIDRNPESSSDSPSDHAPPPIPQRSHARVSSTASATNTSPSSSISSKRPGPAPLRANGNDIMRSRSETVSSSASLRQRRQGFVPTRKPTGELNALSEVASEVIVQRLWWHSKNRSLASRVKARVEGHRDNFPP